MSKLVTSLAAYMTQTMVVDGTPVTFEIWDTAGQEVEAISMLALIAHAP